MSPLARPFDDPVVRITSRRSTSTALLVQLYLTTQAWKRPETQRVLRSKLGAFAAAYPILPQSPLEFLPYLQRRQATVKEWTYRGDFRVIYRFFVWCAKQHGVVNPMADMVPPRKPKTVPQRIEDHEARAVYAYAAAHAVEHPEWLALAQLLLGTGMRIGELTALRRSNVMLDHIVIPTGKTGGRIVPIPHEDFHALIERVGKGDHLWLTDGKPRSVKGLTNTWRMLCGHVGVFGRKAGPHSARHRFAVKLLENTGDIRAVQWALGHETLTSTVIYLKMLEGTALIQRWASISPLKGVA